MEKGNENNNKPQDSTDTTESASDVKASLFTKEEIRATTKAFALAWIKGDVTINFPTADVIMAMEKQKGNRIDFRMALSQEISNKQMFSDTISILTGVNPSTPQEQEEAISTMFFRILALRCGGRIKGDFGKKEDYDARLSKIEEEIIAMNGTIEELVIFYRSLPKR